MSTDQRPNDPTDDPLRTEGLDPGAFVGSRPERQAETIPGGIGPDDERIAAHSTQVGQGGPAGTGEDTLREAGQNR